MSGSIAVSLDEGALEGTSLKRRLNASDGGPQPKKMPRTDMQPPRPTTNEDCYDFFLCPICKNPMQSRKPTLIKCGHVYCNECILKQIRTRRKCVICKARALIRDLVTLYL